MTISFRNTFGDRFAFLAYHAPRNPLLLLMSAAFFLMVTFMTLVPAFQQMPHDKPAAVRVIAFIILELMLVCFIVALWAVLALLTMISRRNKPFICQKTITLGDEGFIVESQYGRSETRWTAVQKLARTRTRFFIYLGQASALVIPRRAFENKTNWDAFYDYCRERTKREATAPTPTTL